MPITPEGAWRYADLELDARRGRLLAVREDHTGPGEAVNAIVAIPLDGAAGVDPAAVQVLVGGSDFVSSPRLSPDGSRLAWLRWDHPNLPWDGSEGVVAELDAAGVPGAGTRDRRRRRHVVRAASLVPRWEPRSRPRARRVDRAAPLGRGAAHRVDVRGSKQSSRRRTGTSATSSHGVAGDGSIIAIGRANGRDRLWRIDPAATAAPTTFDLPFTELAWLAVRGHEAVAIAAAPDMFRALVRIDLESGAWTVVRRSSDRDLDPSLVAIGEPVEFPTTGNRTAHGILYRPTNPAFRAPDGELPPLVVTSHGGPTSAASSGLQLPFQLLTSRGIAVLDVDYGGSTGYGRAYRKRLEGTWGVTDVDDCVAGALEMARRGEADGARLAIEGGSASGYTALCALAFRDVFAAGVSYFGLGNLEAFAAETHKFESRYLDRLIGPYPEARATLPGALADPPPGGSLVPGPRPPGARRPRRAAERGRAHRGGAGGEGDPARLPALRGRGPRVPTGREHRPVAPRPRSRSTAASSGSSRPTTCRPCHGAAPADEVPIRAADPRALRRPGARGRACYARRRHDQHRRRLELPLHVRVGDRGSPRQDVRPDLGRDPRRDPARGPGRPGRLRDGDDDRPRRSSSARSRRARTSTSSESSARPCARSATRRPTTASTTRPAAPS